MPRWTRFRRMFGLEPKPDVEAELAFHVEMRIRELIDEGETPERARQRALDAIWRSTTAPDRNAWPSTNDGDDTWTRRNF